ncbi:elongator complex protein 4 [Vairimorpha necatrix]|uniref:Elongator complex protein 4 n=1 Tax=Vairimorpha necatrix TaxID=6039 RepID=A0AAX4JBM8_9MICR
MSSFIRNQNLKKRKTGIPIFDTFINTLDNGIFILIKEDEYSYMHNFLLNIFMSEGVHENEKNLLTVNKDGLPEIYDRIDNLECTEQLSKMYIAWRYKDLRRKNEECEYSLTNYLEAKHERLLKKDTTLSNIISKLKNTKNFRISLYSLFSPSYDCENIEKNLYEIRKFIRENNHICMVSIPTFFYPNINFNQFFDVVLSLDSNIFTGYLPNYKAILHFEKISLVNKIRENQIDTFKYGIKFSKNRIIIEKIDIPPEDIAESNGCMNF